MIIDYNEIDLSQYENNLIEKDTITKDLEKSILSLFVCTYFSRVVLAKRFRYNSP